MTHPFSNTATNGFFQAHFLRPGAWLSGWLARRRKEESHPSVGVKYELGNERFNENGYFRISTEQARRERIIDVQWLTLKLNKI
jgi:hypothetical protein